MSLYGSFWSYLQQMKKLNKKSTNTIRQKMRRVDAFYIAKENMMFLNKYMSSKNQTLVIL